MKAEKKNYWILSGEGEVGTWEKHHCTLTGAKRIATKERCGGDRWAHACPAHWPQAKYCVSAGECDIDRLTEADMVRMHDGQK